MWRPYTGKTRQTESPVGIIQPSTELVIANFFVLSYFSVEGQVSGLCTPFSHYTSSAYFFFLSSSGRSVMFSLDRSDIVEDNIFCALFLLLFHHCLWWFRVTTAGRVASPRSIMPHGQLWFRGNHSWPCGITSL